MPLRPYTPVRIFGPAILRISGQMRSGAAWRAAFYSRLRRITNFSLADGRFMDQLAISSLTSRLLVEFRPHRGWAAEVAAGSLSRREPALRSPFAVYLFP